MKLEPLNIPIKISFNVEVFPSEEVEKVKHAVSNLLPEIEIISNSKGLSGESKDIKCLAFIYEQIRTRRISAIIWRLYLKNLKDDVGLLYFNKQAAYVKSLNICENPSESPLGPIILQIHCTDSDLFLKWLAPGV